MFLVLKMKHLVICAVAAIAVIAVSAGAAWGVASGIAKKERKLPIYCVQTEEKVIALTFDAAWGADKTKTIADILTEYDAKATFFLVGFWMEKYSDEVKYLDEKGIEIGNHSNKHPDLTGLSEAQIKSEIETVNTMIKNLIGKTPRFFRAPYGAYNNKVVGTVESLGMQCIQWDVDTLDWKGLSGAEIARRITDNVKNGSIVLQHNNSDHITEAMPIYLKALKEQGYRFVTLSELVARDNYTIDHSGKQIKK